MKKKVKNKQLIHWGLTFIILLFIIFLIRGDERQNNNGYPLPIAKASSGDNVTGYAWSDNIGWISFNCIDGGVGQSDICSTSEYGVSVGADGELFGYAWSDNIGWVSFNESDLNGCPKGTCKAKLVGGSLKGWAKVLSADGNGWDGWISLSTQPAGTINYGVTLNEGTSLFEGYAWGGEVIGWIKFDPVYGGVNFTGAPPSITFFNVDTVETGNKPYAHWTTENVVRCDLTSSTLYEDLNACQNGTECQDMTVLIEKQVWEETKYTLACFNGIGVEVTSEFTPYKSFELSANPLKVEIDFTGGGATTTPTEIRVISQNGFKDNVSLTADLSNLLESPGEDTTNQAFFVPQTLSFTEYFTNGIKSVLEIFASQRFVGEKTIGVLGNTNEPINIVIDAGDINPVYEEI